MSKKVKIRSYNKVWKIENRIYAIFNLKLPVPVNPREVLYFIIIAFIFLILSFIFPFVKAIPGVLRYLMFPILISQFFLKFKLDGKMPQKYFVALIKHLFTKKDYVERFAIQNPYVNEKVKLVWFCSRGNIYSERKEKKKNV